MILIKNKKFQALEPDSINFFVGRGSPLGNCFAFQKGTKAEFLVANREEAISKYKEYLLNQIESKSPSICNELNKIFKAAKNNPHGKICLWCFCYPRDCHARIIKEIIEDKLK